MPIPLLLLFASQNVHPFGSAKLRDYGTIVSSKLPIVRYRPGNTG
jgi:hypothetical protein